MIHSSDQLKALVRNESGGDNNKALLMIRKFMMDRFLERLSVSSFRDNFILKGGILVSSMAGIENRSTMDIDTTIQGFNLDEETVFHVINEIAGVSLEDEVTFLIKKITHRQ